MEKQDKSKFISYFCSECDRYYDIEVGNDETRSTFACERCGGRLHKIK